MGVTLPTSLMNLLVKPLTGLLGLALTIAGIGGFFVPSGMLWVFEVDTMHNIVHLVSGLIGLFAFNSSQFTARWYLIIFGIIYLIVGIIGFVMAGDILGLFHANAADNYLHLGIGIVSIIVAFGSGK
jgi:hypothetical protein